MHCLVDLSGVLVAAAAHGLSLSSSSGARSLLFQFPVLCRRSHGAFKVFSVSLSIDARLLWQETGLRGP